ncbi:MULTISPECIES: hypothetical protein [unclassified Stenotrophomonas maltophilia group]|uniref:hypothetical protein n=1 Tax=unclassified Stenotrophomonas maltophilia group TaxID=2961925 RepID=UPI003BF8C95B
MTTDNKTLAVDVLAVIDGLSALWRDESKIVGRWDSADELDSIRAAVAELIEAAGAYHKARNIQQRVDSSARLAAALARVKGESA